MPISHLIACFFGGLFLANAFPHLAAGTTGRPFQTPFATPSGEGLSSSTTNVVWGFVNAAIAYALLILVAKLDLHTPSPVAITTLGAFLISLFGARHFGRFHGGNSPA